MLRTRVKRFLSRHRRNRVLRRLNALLLDLYKGFENCDYDLHHNGEQFILRTIGRILHPQVIFDVGANQGAWTAAAASCNPQARIYSFEIVPETYERLAAACQPLSNVEAVNCGLSDKPGQIAAYYTPDRSSLATCVETFSEAFHRYDATRVTADVTTGDAFCAERGIDSIDLLKLDVEGHEPSVLNGFRRMLERERIRVIQFEYGYVNAHIHFLLKDFYDLLEPYGMQIGKIYPNYVEFKTYDYQDENFFGPNYLAVHASQEPLIAALR